MMSHRSLWWIVSIAIAVRLGLLFVLSAEQKPEYFMLSDTGAYVQIAGNLLAGHGFSQSTTTPYLPDSMRTPGMPLLIAVTKAVFGGTMPYLVLQVVMAGALVVLTYLIARMITNSERPALLAAGLMAFEPYAVFINTSLLTESVYALVITLAAYLVLRFSAYREPWSLAAASALFGFAALTRPIAEFMPFLLVAFVLWREPIRSSGKLVAVALIPFLIVIAPWVMRNHSTFGVTALSSGGLQNVYSDLGATILVYDEGGVWRDKKNWLEADFAARHGIPVDTIQQNLELSPVLFREGIGIMLDHPKGTIKSFLAISLAFATSDVWTFYPQKWGWLPPFSLAFSPTQSLLNDGLIATFLRVWEASSVAALLVAVAGRLFWIATMILFAVGIVVSWRRGGLPRSFAIVALVSLLYYLGLVWSTGAGVNGRYRYPLDPLIFTAAVVGCAAVASRIKNVLRWRKGL